MPGEEPAADEDDEPDRHQEHEEVEEEGGEGDVLEADGGGHGAAPAEVEGVEVPLRDVPADNAATEFLSDWF